MWNQDEIAKARAIIANQARQKQLEDYNAQKSQLDNKYNGGLGGFLGGIIGGIGKGVSDVGNTLIDMFGSSIASARDLGSIITTGKSAGEEEKWLKSRRGTDDINDARLKTGGQALNAATTLASTAVPGLGSGAAAKALGGTIANTAAGAIGGVADEFQQQGKDAQLDSIANRAISGAAAGLATGGLNKKIGNATGKYSSALLNNKLATSTIGRGALSGAVGGATGAGTSAALGGGDIAQAALQGGLSGAVAGGTQAGLMSGANRLAQGMRGRLDTNQQGATTTPETTTATTEEPFAAYGESQLAKRTRGNQAAEALRRFGNTLEGAQTNITRAAARDLGIESTGKTVENVRRKTGLTNLETQAQLARELTGGADSLMDTIQRNALSATEDGSGKYTADTTKLLGDVEGIVRKYANRTNMKGEAGLNKLIDDVRNDIVARDTDLLSKANNFKASAAELRGKGIVNPSEGDSAKAKIYAEIGKKLDDLSYNAIPKDNVNDMFDATISEMRARATQAQNNGNREIANAYNNLADNLDKQPRTIKAYRSFKKDFVDVAQINQLTARADNGAGLQLGNNAAGAIKRFGNTVLNRPINAALAKAGAAVNSAADLVDNLGTQTGNGGTPTQPLSQDAQLLLGNFIGRTEGQNAAGDMIQNARKAQDYQNLEDMFAGLQTGSDGSTMAQTNGLLGANQMQQQSPLLAQMQDISNAMSNALAAGDVKAYGQLADLYKDAYNTYQMQEKMYGTANPQSNLSTAEKNQLAKLQSAGSALDQLESLYTKAGGGQGVIGGNIANFLGGLGLNSDVNTYNQLSQGLINQIGAAIGKTDSLNTEGEVQRALSLVPKITDDNQTAMNKLATLRSLLQTNTGTYNQLYGA